MPKQPNRVRRINSSSDRHSFFVEGIEIFEERRKIPTKPALIKITRNGRRIGFLGGFKEDKQNKRVEHREKEWLSILEKIKQKGYTVRHIEDAVTGKFLLQIYDGNKLISEEKLRELFPD